MELKMPCTCKLDGVREVEARRLRIAERMQLPRMANLGNALVFSLAFDFGCDAWLCGDQWLGLSVETTLEPDGIFVQCDHPFDGLAVVWEYLAERHPERVSTGPGFDSLIVAASAGLFAMCEATNAPRDAHRATIPEADKPSHWCDECKRLMEPYVDAHCALDDAWGAECFERAIAWAYGDDNPHPGTSVAP